MTTMLERAARAVCELEGLDPDELVSLDPAAKAKGLAHERVPCWTLFEPIARAVLMAVREPPSEVVEAGMIAGGFNGMADLAFTAMIDAILNERDGGQKLERYNPWPTRSRPSVSRNALRP